MALKDDVAPLPYPTEDRVKMGELQLLITELVMKINEIIEKG